MKTDFVIVWSNNKKLIPVYKQDIKKLGLQGYSNRFEDFCYRLERTGKFLFGVCDIKDRKGNVIECRKHSSIWMYGDNNYWVDNEKGSGLPISITRMSNSLKDL